MSISPSPESPLPARVARTSDGYSFTEQPDGTWSDGDMTFDSLEQLLQEDPDTHIDGLPVRRENAADEGNHEPV